MIQALLCKLNLRHDWHVEHTDDGRHFRRCVRCGRDDDSGGRWTNAPGAWAGPSQ